MHTEMDLTNGRSVHMVAIALLRLQGGTALGVSMTDSFEHRSIGMFGMYCSSASHL